MNATREEQRAFPILSKTAPPAGQSASLGAFPIFLSAHQREIQNCETKRQLKKGKHLNFCLYACFHIYIKGNTMEFTVTYYSEDIYSAIKLESHI